MKRFFLLNWLFFSQLDLWVMAGDATTNHWGTVTNQVQLSIAVKNAGPIVTNQPVTLLVQVRNLSTHRQFALFRGLAEHTNPVSGVGLTVISPAGKVVRPPPNRNREGGSGQMLSLEPKQTVEFSFGLSNIFRFEEVGTYEITARKVVCTASPFGKDPFEVVSGSLSFSVVSGK